MIGYTITRDAIVGGPATMHEQLQHLTNVGHSNHRVVLPEERTKGVQGVCPAGSRAFTMS